MSNKGTTLKAVGETQQAIDWWWKAVHMKPTYWDAVVRFKLKLTRRTYKLT